MVNDELVKVVAGMLWERNPNNEFSWAESGEKVPMAREHTLGVARTVCEMVEAEVLAAARKRAEALYAINIASREEGVAHDRALDAALAAIGGQDTGKKTKEVDDGE